MNILITGGAGFIGRHLAAALADNGRHSIIVFDNLYRGSEKILAACGSRAQFVYGDIRDRHMLLNVMKGVEVVFHLAAVSNVLGASADLDYSFSTNVVGTYNVLSAATQAGVKRVMFTSSREVYGEQPRLPVCERCDLKPKNAYGVSKMVGEAYCRVFQAQGLPVTILRLSNVFGPQDQDRVMPIFISNALRGEPVVLYGGDQVLDFVWIGTVVKALLRSAEMACPSDPLNIGSGTGITVRELAHLVLRATGSHSPVIEQPSRSLETRGFIADLRAAVDSGLVDEMSSDLDPSHLECVIEDMRTRLAPIESLPIAESARATAPRL